MGDVLAYEPPPKKFIPPVNPDGSPRLNIPQTPEDYLDMVGQYVSDKVVRGIWSRELAELTLENTLTQISSYGIQENSPLYQELIAEPYRQWQQQTTQWQKEESTRQREEYVTGATEKAREFQISQEQAKSKEWQDFNKTYQQILDTAKKYGANYDKVKGELFNQINAYAVSAGLDQRAVQILSQQAETAAFNILPQAEQTRLRAIPETARVYQRGEIDVWGQPVKIEGAPEYSRVFQEQVSGMQGPQPYKDWFASRYPSLMAGFTEKGGTKIQAEQAWTSYLSSAGQRLQEEYARISPYQRGQRPSAYAPQIRKVGF